MQKLEEIMRAEEAARRLIDRARDDAASTVRAAEDEAGGLIAEARENARARASEYRENHMARARAQAAEIERQSDEGLATTLERARAAVPHAVAGVLGELVD